MRGAERKSETRFPDPSLTTEEGLLCVGGDLEVETLVDAYSHGIFPWPQTGYPMLWFSPVQRGVIDFSELHFPSKFLRRLPRPQFRISFNQVFAEVIRECVLVPRSHETGTWILPKMQEAYIRLHAAGFAHSVECWQDEVLVGGLYGVFIKGVFSGESMFYKVSDASKRCLHALTSKLAAAGIKWMDVQMVTPVLEALGGKYIARDDYLSRLDDSQRKFEHFVLNRDFKMVLRT